MNTQKLREAIREGDTFDTMLSSIQAEVEERRNLLATTAEKDKEAMRLFKRYQAVFTALVQKRKGIMRTMELLSELISLVEKGE